MLYRAGGYDWGPALFAVYVPCSQHLDDGRANCFSYGPEESVDTGRTSPPYMVREVIVATLGCSSRLSESDDRNFTHAYIAMECIALNDDSVT